MFDEAGQIASQEITGAYGAVIDEATWSAGSVWKIDDLHGSEIDRDNEVMHFGVRQTLWRDGMWMQPEPLLATPRVEDFVIRPGHLSRHYAGGNPIVKEDRSGRFTIVLACLSGCGLPVLAPVVPAVVGGGAATGTATTAAGTSVVAGAAIALAVVAQPDIHAQNTSAEVAPASTVSQGETKSTEAQASKARFVAQPDGTMVDTHATPQGSYDQPDGGRTDVLQKEDHGAGPSHTHDPKTNTNPKTGETFTNGRTRPGRPVSPEDVKNIESGAAKPSKPKGR